MGACRHGLCASGSLCANAILCTSDMAPTCCSTVRSAQGAVSSDRQVSVRLICFAMRHRARRKRVLNRC
eukprot:2084809-Pleurochrysis_carterae.AAC.2